MVEGRFEVKLPTIYDKMDRCKAEKRREEKKGARSKKQEARSNKQEARSKKQEERRKKKSPKKGGPGVRKGRKVAKHCAFPMICGSGGSKSRLAKAAGAEPCGQMRDEKVARRCGPKHISKSKV